MGIKNKRAGKDNFPVLFYCLLQDSTTIHKTITTIHGFLQRCTTFALLYIGIVYLYTSVLRLLKVHFQEKIAWNTQNGGAFLFYFEVKNAIFLQLFGIKSCVFLSKNEKSPSKYRVDRFFQKCYYSTIESDRSFLPRKWVIATPISTQNKNLCA